MSVDLDFFCDPEFSWKVGHPFAFRGGVAATDARLFIHNPSEQLQLPPVDELWWDDIDKPADWLKVDKLDCMNSKSMLQCPTCYGRGRIGYGVERCHHPNAGVNDADCFLCDNRGWLGGVQCDGCNGVGQTTDGTLCWIESVPFAYGYLRKLSLLGRAEVRLLRGVKPTSGYKNTETLDVLAFRTNTGWRGFLMPLSQEDIEDKPI